MKRAALFLVIAMIAGCHHAKTTAKYFSGEPVEHWLKAINDTDPKTRKKAADVLGNVGPVDPGAIPALINALKDSDAKVRDAAVLGLSKNGPAASAAAPALEEATKDQDEAVRKHAAAALQRVRSP